MPAYQAIFQGGIAVGNIIWGQISVQSDERLALILSAIGLMLGALTITKYRLMKDGNSKIDKTPFLHWPIPNIIVGSGIEQKPVLIKIEYKIDPTKKMDLRVMKE